MYKYKLIAVKYKLIANKLGHSSIINQKIILD